MDQARKAGTLDLQTTLSKIVPWALVCALSIASGLLLAQNANLRSEGLRRSLVSQRLVPGDRVPRFTAPSLTETISVDYVGNGQSVVLLYLSPDCEYCDEQMPFWTEMLERAAPERFEFVVLAGDFEARDKVREYVAEHGLAQVPLAFVSEAMRSSYRLFRTPTTLVVGNDGIVDRVWVGRWNPGMTANARSLFGY